jgi:lipopolysaccharide/colanic/teichoic acid biosynthesis glycosyltransferase
MKILRILLLLCLMSLKNTSVNLAVKRTMDVVCSSLGLVILSPIFLFIAIIIKLDTSGPIFYNAVRVGQQGKLFHIHKFRTMVLNADKMGSGLTGAGDRRVTRLGRLLRKTKLDELPQLINVLFGTMSLVGPRPEDPRYVALYSDEQRRVLEARPGITSLASVCYRHEEQLLSGSDLEQYYIATVMPAKLQYDLYYIDHGGVWEDLKVIYLTFIALIH